MFCDIHNIYTYYFHTYYILGTVKRLSIMKLSAVVSFLS